MWRRLLALLLGFLLVGSLCFSEEPGKTYTLTETEYNRLRMDFAGLRTENEGLRNIIGGLQTSSEKLKVELTEVRDSLKMASESLTKYAEGMNRALWTARIKYGVGGVIVGALLSGIFYLGTIF